MSEETKQASPEKSSGGTPSGPGAEGPGFDEKLAQLEAVVVQLERGELGLEPAIQRYKEGVTLLKECREVLSGFRRQVEELGEDGGLADFEGDPDGDDGA